MLVLNERKMLVKNRIRENLVSAYVFENKSETMCF